jgi:AsmA protein
MGDTAADIIKNASFTGSFDCEEALQKDFRIENLKFFLRAAKGIYNFEPLAIGAFVYFDKKTGEKTELKKINLAIKDLSVVDTSGVIIKNISFTGNLDCKEVRIRDLTIGNVKSAIKAEKGIIYLMSLTMDIFGAKAEGDATADESEVDAVYKINLKVSKLDFEKLEVSFGTKKIIGGKGTLYASLTMKEKGSRNLMSSMDGTFSLRGDNVVMYTMDLDKILSSFETSQKFSLVDVGAFFIAGPLSTVALKGYRYGDVYNQTREGQSTITQFISHWEIKDGVADATDCALATHHNRVALKGKLDLVSEQYDNVIVALLDDKGCAKFKQSISGPFGSPQVGAVSAVESLAGPIINLYRTAKHFVQGGKCEVFYNGSVQQSPE